VAFAEAATPEFAAYAKQVVTNAKALAQELLARGYTLVTGGTDNHLLLVDLTPQAISGRRAAAALNRCGIELNGNAIPFDPRKPFDPSGVRVGLAALTSRGMEAGHMAQVAAFIDRGITEAAVKSGEPDDSFCAALRAEVAEYLRPFPAPGLGDA
jgi:glycine hydroxymethyltransferase